MNIYIYSVFQNDFGFFFPNFLLFSTLKNKPSRSRGSASWVKENCVRASGGAPGVKEECVRGQGEVLQLNITHSLEALLLDPRCTSP